MVLLAMVVLLTIEWLSDSVRCQINIKRQCQRFQRFLIATLNIGTISGRSSETISNKRSTYAAYSRLVGSKVDQLA